MPNGFSRRGSGRQPVIYAGRFVDQIEDTDLPNDCIVLGEQDAVPRKLAEVLDRANTLAFLDLPSFSFEAMTEEHWDIPIVVVFPSGFEPRSSTLTFGPALFERLGFFDCIVTPDSTLWEELRRKYGWAEGQRIPMVGNYPSEVATAVCTLFEVESTSTDTPNRGQNEAARYWRERRLMLATSVAHREGQCVGDDPRLSKALHRLQAAALEPQFAVPRGERDNDVSLDVLEVGTGVGRWVSSFDPTRTRFSGIDARKDLVRFARANFPEGHFDLLGSELLFPYEDESFDLVFSVTLMHHYPLRAKRTLLSEMWRVTRPGGRLLFLEDFVFTSQSEKPTVYPMSVGEFENLIIEATAGQVVLEHVESLRYPGEDLRRGAVISLLRLGVPKTQ
jgi:SAM-dependent methyltransferase